MSSNVVPVHADSVRVRIAPEWLPLWRRKGRPGVWRFASAESFDSGWSESVDVNYAANEVVGRVEGYRTWVGNSNRTITLNFHFTAKGETPGLDAETVARFEAVAPVRWLDSLRYPVIDESGSQRPPPNVLLELGDFYFARCVVTACEVSWRPPFMPRTLTPMRSEASVTFTEVNRSPHEYELSGAARLSSPSRSSGSARAAFAAAGNQRGGRSAGVF